MQCYIQRTTMTHDDRSEVRNAQGDVVVVAYGTPRLVVEATIGGFGIIEGFGPRTCELLGQRVSVGGHSGVVIHSSYSQANDAFPTVEVVVRMDGEGGPPLEAWWMDDQDLPAGQPTLTGIVTGRHPMTAPPSPPQPVAPRLRPSRVLPAHLRGVESTVDPNALPSSRTTPRRINLAKRSAGI